MAGLLGPLLIVFLCTYSVETLRVFTTPEQIHLALGKDGSTEMTVSWMTWFHSESVVRYGTSPDKLTHKADGIKKQYDKPLYTSGTFHHVKLTGLDPDTKYWYVVGDHTHHSKTLSFTTLPHNKAKNVYPFEVGVIGDLGQTIHSKHTVQQLHKDFRFVMVAGDMSYADCDDTRWDKWALMVEPDASHRAWMTAAGNHEIEASPDGDVYVAYEARFGNPEVAPAIKPKTNSEEIHAQCTPFGFKVFESHTPCCCPNEFLSQYDYGQSFYTYTAGPTKWIVLNMYTSSDPGSLQYKWLTSELSKVDHDATPWLIVVVHGPMYNANLAHKQEKNSEDIKKNFEHIFYKAGVDIVISGHVHAYQRTHPIFMNERNESGITYIVIGDGGNREGLDGVWNEQSPLFAHTDGQHYGFAGLTFTSPSQAHWMWYGADRATRFRPPGGDVKEPMPLDTIPQPRRDEVLLYNRKKP